MRSVRDRWVRSWRSLHWGPFAMTWCTSACRGWGPNPVSTQVAPAWLHAATSSPGSISTTRSNGPWSGGRCCAISAASSARASGPGSSIGNIPSHAAARARGRRFGHLPATQTGILGGWTGGGSNSPAPRPGRPRRPGPSPPAPRPLAPHPDRDPRVLDRRWLDLAGPELGQPPQPVIQQPRPFARFDDLPEWHELVGVTTTQADPEGEADRK